MNRQSFVIVERLRNLLAAQAVCFVLCGLLPAGTAEAASDGAFKTSSGNIVCSLNNEIVECVIKSGLKPAPPRQRVCNGGDPVSNRVNLLANGIAAPVPCAGDPGPLVYEAEAKELAYGSTMKNAEIGCAAFEFGLVCINSKGRGFFLSRAAAGYF
jgi:hypothetical protein